MVVSSLLVPSCRDWNRSAFSAGLWGQSCQGGVGGLRVGWQRCQRPGCLMWTSRRRGIFGSFVQPVGLLLALCGSEKEDRQNSVQQ